MNTNSTHVITATISAGLMAGVIGVAVTGNILAGAAIGVSYLAVAGLIAIATSDYRSAGKPYFAAPVVTGHFKPTAAKADAAREKARLAA
ncbi:MAG TPA: hypothetical protein VG734_02050 [Lacunisphaera sp.]|nr:hypothetical protein [Lacunisphaera sp.]